MEKRKNRSVANATKKRRETIGKDFSSTLFKLPEGVEEFSIDTADPVKIDVVPYEVGKGNPKADAGEFYWERTFWLHRNVGPNKDWVLCPAKILKQPCPVCEYYSKVKDANDGDEAAVKPLKLSKRMLVNLITPKEPTKVKVWHVSHAYFGDAMDEALAGAYESPSDNMDNFCDDHYLKLVTEKGFEGKGYKVTRVDFKKRPKPVSEEVLDQAVCLDDIFVFKTYDEIKALLNGTAEDDDTDTDAGEKETDTDTSNKSIYADEPEETPTQEEGFDEKPETKSEQPPTDATDDDESWDE